jgi:hypothetical protein
MRHLTRSIILSFLFLVFVIPAFAQDNSVKGFVYEESTGEPLMFTNVYLKGTTYGGSTDRKSVCRERAEISEDAVG